MMASALTGSTGRAAFGWYGSKARLAPRIAARAAATLAAERDVRQARDEAQAARAAAEEAIEQARDEDAEAIAAAQQDAAERVSAAETRRDEAVRHAW